ncbi:UDP-N-acetylglucosamine 2-epimerase [Escherichia sp. R-CC3]
MHFVEDDCMQRNQKALKQNEYMLVSAHREENIDHEDNFYRLMESLNAVAETYHMPIVYSTHPLEG